MSLKTKVPILIVVAIAVAAAATGGFVAVELRSLRASQFEDTALAGAAMVQESLRRHMLDGRSGSVQSVTRARTPPSVDRIAVVSAEGLIVASTDRALTGTVADDGLVWQALRSGEVAIRSGTSVRPYAYDLVSPIANSVECATCHDQSRSVLGAVHIGLNTTADDANLTSWLLSRAEQAAIMMVVIGVLLTVGLKMMILNPLAALEHTARLISQGDYSARADASRGDEIGTLGRTINDSARRIAQHTTELTRRNSELENDTQQRTAELHALNAVVAAASESLDFREVMQIALSRTLAASGFDSGAIVASGDLGLLVRTGVPGELLEQIKEHEMGLSGACPVTGESELPTSSGDSGRLALPAAIDAAGREAGYMTTVCVPVVSDGERLGTVWLFGRSQNRPGSQQERWLAAIADAIAVSARRMRFSERLRAANDRLTALLERAVNGGFDVTYENDHLAKCWVEKGCDNVQCPARGSQNLRCWQIAGSFSPSGLPGPLAGTLSDCKECQVFRKSCGRDEITSIGESFNTMMKLLDTEAKKRSELRRQLIERLMSAQEDERKRVARELHDQTGQSLTLLLLGLKHLERATDLEQVRNQVVAIEEQTLQALDDVHRLAVELRPTTLDELGLVSALRAHLRQTSARCGLRTDMKVTGPENRLLPAIETALYRIVQESVNNVVKHADARSVVVSLDRKPLSVAVTIQDDGRGFDVAAFGKKATSQSSGLGLAGIKERAVLLGGTVEVSSCPGEGTSVHVELPVTTEARTPEAQSWHSSFGAERKAEAAVRRRPQSGPASDLATVRGRRRIDG